MEKGALSPKVKAMYRAVIELFEEGADINNLTVAEITKKAGIGKGTAYEYVSNKEEIIAGAIYNQMIETCCKMERDLLEKETFFDKVEYMLLFMEAQTGEASNFMKAIHIMSDNSPVSKLLCDMSQNKKNNEILIQDVVVNILKTRLEKYTEINAETARYLALNIFSKIICYGMYLCSEKEIMAEKKIAVRRMMSESICRETDAVLAEPFFLNTSKGVGIK